MFSKLVFVCLVVASAKAAPAATDVVPLEKQQPTVIPIVSQSEELESNGTYKFSYETGNGIKREESSYTKVLPKVEGRSADSNEGGESDESNEIHVQEGSYSYTAPDGTLISVRYIADENGFRPVGDHIPQPIIAAAAAGGSSSEKSGRALKVADSANSASAPKPAVTLSSRSAAAPEPKSAAASAPEPEKAKADAVPESAPVEPSEASTTVAAKTEEATTENASDAPSTTVASVSTTEASPSTTEGSTTTNASSEATEASEGTTAEAATKDATTVAASEPASTSADASTTEAATTAAATTVAA